MAAQSTNADGLRKAARRVFWEASQIEKAEQRAREKAFSDIAKMLRETIACCEAADHMAFHTHGYLNDGYLRVVGLEDAVRLIETIGSVECAPLTLAPSEEYVERVLKVKPDYDMWYAAMAIMFDARDAAFRLLGGRPLTEEEKDARFQDATCEIRDMFDRARKGR